MNNRQNSNLKYITRSYNNIHFNNNNYMNTYNGKKIKLNIGIEKINNRASSFNNCTLTNTLGKKKYINLIHDSTVNKRKNSNQNM